jgi:hypothetical protein
MLAAHLTPGNDPGTKLAEDALAHTVGFESAVVVGPSGCVVGAMLERAADDLLNDALVEVDARPKERSPAGRST